MTHTSFDQKFNELPPYVKEWMAEHSLDINANIANDHGLDTDETASMVWVISRTIIGDIKLQDFLNQLRSALPEVNEVDLKEIALEITTKRFYPIRDHLKGLEDLIKDLGGEIPENIPSFKEEYEKLSSNQELGVPENISEEIGQEEKTITLPIKELLEKKEGINNQFITSKPIQLKNDGEKNATVKNWLQDYRERVGAPPHSSMERTEYLFKSENGKRLDESERKILGGVLKSYDEGGNLPVDPVSGKLVLSEIFHQAMPAPRKTEVAEKNNENINTQKQPNNVIDLRGQ